MLSFPVPSALCKIDMIIIGEGYALVLKQYMLLLPARDKPSCMVDYSVAWVFAIIFRKAADPAYQP